MSIIYDSQFPYITEANWSDTNQRRQLWDNPQKQRNFYLYMKKNYHSWSDFGVNNLLFDSTVDKQDIQQDYDNTQLDGFRFTMLHDETINVISPGDYDNKGDYRYLLFLWVEGSWDSQDKIITTLKSSEHTYENEITVIGNQRNDKRWVYVDPNIWNDIDIYSYNYFEHNDENRWVYIQKQYFPGLQQDIDSLRSISDKEEITIDDIDQVEQIQHKYEMSNYDFIRGQKLSQQLINNNLINPINNWSRGKFYNYPDYSDLGLFSSGDKITNEDFNIIVNRVKEFLERI